MWTKDPTRRGGVLGKGNGIKMKNPKNEILEIKEQLSSEKRKLAFFIGAGSSMAVGLPGIVELTSKVHELLEEPYKKQYKEIWDSLPGESNVEQILDRIRLYRELFVGPKSREIDGLKSYDDAKNLDIAVCQKISILVNTKIEKQPNPYNQFAQWLSMFYKKRDRAIEIFTINYDLLFEQAFENASIPYFDGFIGSVKPFFSIDSVDLPDDGISNLDYPPRTWTRLWKLHGSINWQFDYNKDSSTSKIIRIMNEPCSGENELVIFPSREKYIQSRKMPFWAFQERMRNFIGTGETQLIILGYRFADKHLNDILFSGLRSNSRLNICVFSFNELPLEIYDVALNSNNLSLYCPETVCIGGIRDKWELEVQKDKNSDLDVFWDSNNRNFKLGDFNNFAEFLNKYYQV